MLYEQHIGVSVHTDAVTPIESSIHRLAEAIRPGIQRPGREQLPNLSSATAKNMWTCTSLPAYYFMVWFLIKDGQRLLICLYGMGWRSCQRRSLLTATWNVGVGPRSYLITEMELNETGYNDGMWMELAQDHVWWWNLVLVVSYERFYYAKFIRKRIEFGFDMCDLN
jgi:hypothetical protein